MLKNSDMGIFFVHIVCYYYFILTEMESLMFGHLTVCPRHTSTAM